MPMKQIKTVVSPINRASEHDAEINRLLADGWELKKRTTRSIYGDINEAFNASIIQVLYAELEKNTPPFPEEVTL